MPRVEAALRAAHALLAEKTTLLLTLLGSISQGVLMLGDDGRVVTFNPKACELLDLPASYLHTQPTLADITRYQLSRGDFGDNAERVGSEARAYVLSGAAQSPPTRYLRVTPTNRVLEVKTQPIATGGLVRTFTDVTDYVRADQALARTNLLLQATQSIAMVGGWEVDLRTNTVFWTDEVYRILEVSPLAFQPTSANTIQFFAQEWQAKVLLAILNAEVHGEPHDLEVEMITAKGRRIWAHTKSTLTLEQGEVIKRTSVIRDITAQKQAEAALRQRDDLWKLALESAGDGVWDLNIVTGQATFSQRCMDMYGLTTGGLGLEVDLLEMDKRVHPDDVQQMLKDRKVHFEGKTPSYTNEHRMLCQDGSWKWILTRGMVINRGPNGEPLRMTGTHTDITNRKTAEALIWHQANFDALTELPNRTRLRERLAADLAHCQRQNLKLAVLFIDLDHFKDVNDTLGHHQGDALLIEAADRLRRCVGTADTVARMGGDEFTVVLPDLTDIAYAEAMAQKIIQALSAPFKLGEEQTFVSASIGVTFFPEDATEIDNLYKHADQALYVAKGAGRNRFSCFTPSLQEEAQVRARLASDLRSAIALGQFWVAYQPIVEMASGEVHKAEALIRWNHPTLGLVSPVSFIPIAESSGLIVEIGEWVFRQAATQAAQWRQSRHPRFQISVNKSPMQFHNACASTHHQSWIDHLGTLGLPGQSIAVEITEGLLLDASAEVNAQLLTLREAGIGVSLDDFGTGYSSLSYLQKYDIDYLKIDQSFVRHLTANSKDLALCKAIIVMAHELGIRVIAEGVETAVQRDLLQAAGCDFAQGYFFARPMPADAFSTYLTR